MNELGTSAADGAAAPEEAEEVPTVLLVGNPNSGKTTLFNALTGARAKVGNYPGITVDRRSAVLRLPDDATMELVDLPGTYSLSARSPEEEVAVDAVLGRDRTPNAVVVVVDATALARGLYLAHQVAETGLPLVVALAMMDEARDRGVVIDIEKLSAALGAPCVPIVAPKREGLDPLRSVLAMAVHADAAPHEAGPGALPLPEHLERKIGGVEEAIEQWLAPPTPELTRAWALWALLSLGEDELVGVPEAVRVATMQTANGEDPAAVVIAARYARVDAAVADCVETPAVRATTGTERVDRVLLHPLLGFGVFVIVMGLLFQGLFAWSDPLIGLVEDAVALTQGVVSGMLPEGPVRGLVVDGIIAGVGNVVVFVPQIALLFLFIGFLEDSGYLARVAFVLDRLMGGIGLHGKAFVPMLSGFACAIPAVMATRTIESRRDRVLTMMVVPLTSCSARLPVYVLVIAAVFVPAQGGLVLFGMYFLSVAAALCAAFVLRRTILKGPKPPLVLELPPYRMPLLRNLLMSTWERVRTFLVDAGTVILALTIVLWALLSYPNDPSITARYAELRDDAAVALTDEAALEERLAALEGEEVGAQLRQSFAGRLGHAIEPVIEPLGFDWRIGVGIIGAFAAREVFVSTLGVVFGIAEADEESGPLRDSLKEATWPDGRPLFTPLSGLALMVFFVLACQCMSTLAVVKKETGGYKWPLFMLGYMSALAYVATLLVYQVGGALGFG